MGQHEIKMQHLMVLLGLRQRLVESFVLSPPNGQNDVRFAPLGVKYPSIAVPKAILFLRNLTRWGSELSVVWPDLRSLLKGGNFAPTSYQAFIANTGCGSIISG